MEIVKILLVFLEVVVSILLVGIILVQKSKGEGLGVSFGGGMGETLFGSRAGNILTKITVTLGVIFLVNTLFLAMLYAKRNDKSLMADTLMQQPQMAPAPQQQMAPAPAQAQPAVAQPQGAPTLPSVNFDGQGEAR